MTTKKTSSTSKKKDVKAIHKDKVSATKLAESILEKAKEQSKDMILVSIDNQTQIELPANLTEKEINEHVLKYKKRYNSRKQ